MNRIPIILLALFTFVFNIPAHAMHKEKSRPCCSLRAVLRLCTAATIGCICATVSLSAHHASVKQIKFDYENPGLQISFSNPILGDKEFPFEPPFCDPTIDIEKIRVELDKELGHSGTRITARRVPYHITTQYIDRIEMTISSCTSNTENVAKMDVKNLVQKLKNRKSD